MANDLFKTKMDMMKSRKRTPAGVPCDRCGKVRPLDLHHIIARRYTKPKGEVRALTEVPELLILLCSEECHPWADAGGAHAASECLGLNIRRYGLNAVEGAFRALLKVAPYIRLDLPEMSHE